MPILRYNKTWELLEKCVRYNGISLHRALVQIHFTVSNFDRDELVSFEEVPLYVLIKISCDLCSRRKKGDWENSGRENGEGG